MSTNKLIPNKAADRYAELWAEELRNQLRKAGKDASGRLIKSIKAEAIVTAMDAGIIVYGEDYLKFVDMGVSGTEMPQPGTPYKYSKTGKMPPIREIQQWIRIKNIQPRSGMTPQGLPFAIQRSIWKYGIRPTDVLQKTISSMKSNRRATELFVQAIATNLENNIATEIKP